MTAKKQTFEAYVDGQKISNITNFYYSKDVMDTMGVGELRVPYSEQAEELLKLGAKDLDVKVGTGYYNVYTMRIMKGSIVKHAREGNFLKIQFQDNGAKFKRTCSETYTDKALQDALKQLVEAVDFKLKFDSNVSEETKNKKISSTTTTESAAANASTIGGIAATGTTAATIGSSSTANFNDQASLHGSAKLEGTPMSTVGQGCVSSNGTCCCGEKPGQKLTMSWKNECPFCHGNNLNFIYTPLGQGNGVGNPEGRICCGDGLGKGGCDADFCSTCGKDTASKSANTRIMACDGSAPPLGAGATAATPSTYEDAINQICVDNNLYMYLDADDICHIGEFKEPPKYGIQIRPEDLPRKNYAFINGDLNDSIKITVNYKNGTLHRILGDKKKVTEKDEQKYDQPELDQKGAEEFIQKIAAQTLREKNITLGVRTASSGNIYPGVWCSIPKIDNSTENHIMYACGQVYDVEPNKPNMVDITFKFAPPIPEIAQNSTGAPVSMGTIEAIGKEASKFKYSHSCSDASCLQSTGQGDCYAMSDWLYDKLTAIGVKARIWWCSGPNNHRTVQIDQGKGWEDFPYKGNGYEIEKNFRVSQSRSGCREYKR